MVIGMGIAPIWTIWLHAYREAYRIEVKGQHVDHNKRFFIRSFVAIGIGFAVHFLSEEVSTAAAFHAVICAVYLGTSFWLWFDPFISIHRGRKWHYIPHGEDPHGSKTDKFFAKKKILWVASKIIGIIAGVYLYYWALTVSLPLK
jgi:hypothetical protein